MSLTAELQSLAALKAQGTLTEQEFAQAKAEVIAKYGGTSTATPDSICLSDVHDRSAHDNVIPWGGQIEGATGLTAEWYDQGWGNRKGMVFARRPGGQWLPLAEEVAPHQRRALEVQLPVGLVGASIQFGYRVGGGGGHEICIENAFVHRR